MGGVAEEGEGDWVVGLVARSGSADAAASGVDGLVRVRWIGRHRRRRKEKGGQISTASAVLVPSFGIKGFITCSHRGCEFRLTWCKVVVTLSRIPSYTLVRGKSFER